MKPGKYLKRVALIYLNDPDHYNDLSTYQFMPPVDVLDNNNDGEDRVEDLDGSDPLGRSEDVLHPDLMGDERDDVFAMQAFHREARTLWHGTTLERAKTIQQNGLVPQVGQFTSSGYDRAPFDSKSDLYRSVFAADKSELFKSLAAIVAALAAEDGTDFLDVSDADIEARGALIKISDGEKQMLHRPQDTWSDEDRPGKEFPEDRDWATDDEYDAMEWAEETHPNVEPGDWYSSGKVSTSAVITGPAMIRVFRQAGVWPRPYGPEAEKNKRERIIKHLVQKGYDPEDAIDYADSDPGLYSQEVSNTFQGGNNEFSWFRGKTFSPRETKTSEVELDAEYGNSLSDLDNDVKLHHPMETGQAPDLIRLGSITISGRAYHSTPKQFAVIDPDMSGLGVHFGSFQTALDRAKLQRFEVRPGSRLITYELSVTNPLLMDDLVAWDEEKVFNELDNSMLLLDEDTRSRLDVLAGEAFYRLARSIIENAGYDSVVYKNMHEGPGDDSYIVWNPALIRQVSEVPLEEL